MAMASLLRSGRGMALSRCFGQSLMQRTTPVAGTLVSKQSLMLTHVSQVRIRGPEEESDKIDEVHHWMNERYVAAALIPIIPVALAVPHPVLDTVLCASMVLHSHWRLSGVAHDYIHGQILPKIAQPLVLILSICAFGSLCYFNYYDVGFANAVRMLYTQL